MSWKDHIICLWAFSLCETQRNSCFPNSQPLKCFLLATELQGLTECSAWLCVQQKPRCSNLPLLNGWLSRELHVLTDFSEARTQRSLTPLNRMCCSLCIRRTSLGDPFFSQHIPPDFCYMREYKAENKQDGEPD